jgi:hypothetical protein
MEERPLHKIPLTKFDKLIEAVTLTLLILLGWARSSASQNYRNKFPAILMPGALQMIIAAKKQFLRCRSWRLLFI